MALRGEHRDAQVERAGEARPRRLVGAMERVVLVAQLPAQAASRPAWRWRPQAAAARPRARGAPRRSAAFPRAWARRRRRRDWAAARRCDRARAPAAPCGSRVRPTPNSSHSATSRQLGARRQALAHHALEDRAIDARRSVVFLAAGRAIASTAVRRRASTAMALAGASARRSRDVRTDPAHRPGVVIQMRAARRARARCARAPAAGGAAGAAGRRDTDAARCP